VALTYGRSGVRLALRSSRDLSPAVRIADALVARGKLVEAIDALSEANRARRSPDVERRLSELRYRAFDRLTTMQPASPSWPAGGEDVFPDVAGIPEVRGHQVTVEQLRSAIRRHGSLIVRGLIPPARAQSLIAEIDRLFGAEDTDAARARRWWFQRSHTSTRLRRWNRETGAFLVVDSPSMMFDVIETLEAAGLRELVTAYLGERPALLARKWTLRRVPHDAPMGDWHQDGAFMGKGIRSLNVWLALSHCGDDAPGLEIVARRLEHIVETGTDGAFFDWSVGPAAVERCSHGAIARPIFDAGDAIVFDHMSLHRTVVVPGMRRDRYAIESWFLAPSTYAAMIGSGKWTLTGRPKGHLPIVF
jgi:Phytanoyl-CoA dioxygenase (PhyH)